MQVEIIPALVQQFRETVEGDVRSSWVTDGKADSGVLGLIQPVAAEHAFRAPAAGHRSLAEHVTHLHVALARFGRKSCVIGRILINPNTARLY